MAIKFLNSVNADSGVLYVDAANDRVGIGTTSPDAKLTINTGAGQEGIKIRNVNSIDTFHLGHLGTQDSYLQMKNNAGTVEVLLRTDNGNSYINTGNVGIGTTSPDYKLDVVGDIIINDTSDPTLYMRRNDGTAVSAIMLDTSTDNIIIGATNMDELIFRDDSGEAMRIDGSGNVGIGTTSPSYKLDVTGDIRTSGAFRGVNIALSGYIDLTGHLNHRRQYTRIK